MQMYGLLPFSLLVMGVAGDWVPLCQEGHQYVFTEVTGDWAGAEEQCGEWGGYLARIQSRTESNCLVRNTSLTNDGFLRT